LYNHYFFPFASTRSRFVTSPYGSSRSHWLNTPQSVGLLWTSDQPDTETPTWQHNIHQRQTSMSQAGFEPAIPASESP